jgi:hypothetical protein
VCWDVVLIAFFQDLAQGKDLHNRVYLLSCTLDTVHSRYFFGRTGRIRAVEVRTQKFRANFFRFGRISSIVKPKNLLIWKNFAQNERNSLEIFGTKLNCADSPISGEKNNYCVPLWSSFPVESRWSRPAGLARASRARHSPSLVHRFSAARAKLSPTRLLCCSSGISAAPQFLHGSANLFQLHHLLG